MLGTPVNPTKADHRDTEIWMTGALIQRMKELGTSDRIEHELEWWLTSDDDYPLNRVLKVACKCGWKFKRIIKAAYFTTASSVVNELLTEHALRNTDPNHYTYYPQGV